MRRQVTADELEIFYQKIGAAIWHIQYLEEILVTFLVLKTLSEKQPATEQEAIELKKKHHQDSLGTLINSCTKQEIITPGLFPVSTSWTDCSALLR